VVGKSGAAIAKLVADYDKAQVATSIMFGHPIETYHRHVLYLQPDLHIKHGAYGIGCVLLSRIICAERFAPFVLLSDSM
jgi:hypothetical protein